MRRPRSGHPPAPKVAFICTAHASYTRNETLLAALREYYDVKVIGSEGTTYPSRLASVLPRAFAPIRTSEIVVAGFLAQPLAPLLYLRDRSRPVIVDAFISLYETLCEDRRVVSMQSPAAALARWLDVAILRRADRILTDTAANAQYLASLYKIDRRKFVAIYVGANEELFYPRPRREASGTFDVFYYATFLPLHGVDVIVRAASLLAAERDIRFRIVGDGPERLRVQRLANDLRVPNLTFVNPVPYHELPEMIAQGDVCLGGHFNAQNAKAQRVVPGKVFQFLAMGQPTIAGDCAGVREALVDGVDAVLVPMGDPSALAEAILRLKADPDFREAIGAGGLRRFRRDFSLAATARRLRFVVDSVIERGIVDEAAA